MAETTPTKPAMPAIGTRIVHKDDHAKSKGPVWSVKSCDAPKQQVNIGHVPNHKANIGLKPENRTVSVPEYNKDYMQI